VVVAHFKVIEPAGLAEIGQERCPLLLQRRDGGVDVFGRGIQAELRYSGGHLSALVADHDVKFIDEAHGDSALIFSNQRGKPLIKDMSNSRLAEWKACCFASDCDGSAGGDNWPTT